jgi:HPt (histidine-containing phosphotransfer) domain-containing protein
MNRRSLPQRLRHAESAAGGGVPPPAPASAAPSAPALDAQALARLHALDPDGSRGFVLQVLRTYEASLQRGLGALQQARDEAALERAGTTAHTLKSSSAAVGALAFAAVCADLERLARAGDAAALGAPLGRVLEEAATALAAVRAMLPA